MQKTLPVISQKFSYKFSVKKGQKYAWCSCGLSKKQPLCDGAHREYKNENGEPTMRPIIFEAKEDGVLSLCGCKKSQNGFLCDGMHRNL